MKNVIIVMILIGLLLSLYVLFPNESDKAAPTQLKQQSVLIEKTQHIFVDKSDHLKIETKNDSLLLANQSKPQLSKRDNDDPILEHLILSRTHHACYSHFMMKKYKQDIPDFDSYERFSKIQIDYMKFVEKNCEEINIKHPEYHFELAPKDRPDLSQSIQSSPLSKYFNKDFRKMNHREIEELFEGVAQLNPNLITAFMNQSFAYRLDVVNPKIKQLIKSNDLTYIGKISSWGINLMACELGAYCGRRSQIMYTMCQMEENFCVNDFIELYKTRLTPGVKADIQIALRYYKNLYNVQ